MDGPKQILWNTFGELVWPSTLKHHRQQGKCSCFMFLVNSLGNLVRKLGENNFYHQRPEFNANLLDVLKK